MKAFRLHELISSSVGPVAPAVGYTGGVAVGPAQGRSDGVSTVRTDRSTDGAVVALVDGRNDGSGLPFAGAASSAGSTDGNTHAVATRNGGAGGARSAGPVGGGSGMPGDGRDTVPAGSAAGRGNAGVAPTDGGRDGVSGGPAGGLGGPGVGLAAAEDRSGAGTTSGTLRYEDLSPRQLSSSLALIPAEAQQSIASALGIEVGFASGCCCRFSLNLLRCLVAAVVRFVVTGAHRTAFTIFVSFRSFGESFSFFC